MLHTLDIAVDSAWDLIGALTTAHDRDEVDHRGAPVQPRAENAEPEAFIERMGWILN